MGARMSSTPSGGASGKLPSSSPRSSSSSSTSPKPSASAWLIMVVASSGDNPRKLVPSYLAVMFDASWPRAYTNAAMGQKPRSQRRSPVLVRCHFNPSFSTSLTNSGMVMTLLYLPTLDEVGQLTHLACDDCDTLGIG